MILIFSIILTSCGGPQESIDPVLPTETQKTDFNYLTSINDQPVVEVSGNEFKVTTNNCGSRVSAFETFSRSREFKVTLETEFSDSIRGSLGGDLLIAGAEIEAEVGYKLGIQVGTTETVKTERQIETPPDSITTVSMQWEEIWQTGNVSIKKVDGSEIGDIPFRVLTTLRLSQIGIEDIPCGTLPVNENTAVSTDGPISKATLDTPSPEISITYTPVGMVNENHKVNAYETALGNPYNTGIYLQSGDKVLIEYLYGEWWIGQGSNCNGFGDSQSPTDANGYLDRDGERVEALIGCDNPNRCRPLSSAPWGSLLGMIGENGSFFHVGARTEFVAPTSGILFLTINYFNHNAVTGCPYGDGGDVNVSVSVTPPEN